jgi:peptidoglycan/xylan/chitin deacetylase (PgdA/CDA1 family)
MDHSGASFGRSFIALVLVGVGAACSGVESETAPSDATTSEATRDADLREVATGDGSAEAGAPVLDARTEAPAPRDGTVDDEGASRRDGQEADARGAADATRDVGSVNQIVILKLDDLRGNSNRPQFQQVLDILSAKKVKASFGIIAVNYVDDGTKEDLYAWTRNVAAGGLIEFWNHGLEHNRAADGGTWTEFSGTPLAYQTDHLVRAQSLIQSTCGITMHSFGAPFNQTDVVTVEALKAVPDIDVWMFPDVATAPQFMLTSRVDMEHVAGDLDESFFRDNYARSASAPYIVVQGHPPLWDDAKRTAFGNILDFLLARGVTFMTPYEYDRHKP